LAFFYDFAGSADAEFLNVATGTGDDAPDPLRIGRDSADSANGVIERLGFDRRVSHADLLLPLHRHAKLSRCFVGHSPVCRQTFSIPFMSPLSFQPESSPFVRWSPEAPAGGVSFSAPAPESCHRSGKCQDLSHALRMHRARPVIDVALPPAVAPCFRAGWKERDDQ
jgi:hypothetical protein